MPSARKPGQPTAGGGRVATPPCFTSWISSAPAMIHTTSARTDAASIANNLPTNIASIGIAAAITSMILFDFSSISCDNTIVESISVSRNKATCAICAVLARSLARDPDETATLLTGRSGVFATSDERADAPEHASEQQREQRSEQKENEGLGEDRRRKVAARDHPRRTQEAHHCGASSPIAFAAAVPAIATNAS